MRTSLLFLIFASSATFAQSITITSGTLNGGAPGSLQFRTGNPQLLQLGTGELRGDNVTLVLPGNPTIAGLQCGPNFNTTPPPLTNKPAWVKLDGKWYPVTGSVAARSAEIYPALLLIDGAQIRGCTRPGGQSQTVTNAIMITNSGQDISYLNIDPAQRPKFDQFDAGNVLNVTSSNGDLTCLGSILVNPVVVEFKNGFENPPPAAADLAGSARLKLCVGQGVNCTSAELPL